ncbi:MAG: DMT family transporter, partial [bacterium]|nr:DMT family transporter [bacterium]
GRTTWTALAFLGITSSSIPWLLISWAEETIDSALATVLNSMVPLFTILIAHFTLHDDRITRNRLIGLLIGLLGVVTLTQRGGDVGIASFGSRSNLTGQLAMLVAAFLYAVSGIIARRYLRHLTALVQAFWSMLIAAVMLWISLPVLGIPLEVPRNPVTWVGVVWLGILGAGIASMLFYFMLHAIGPTRASLVTYSIPVVGVSLGVLILGEPLDMYLVSGMILIVAGVSVVNRKPSRFRRRPDSLR